MIKPTAKTKTIKMPGKERPAASRLGIQWPPTTKPHLRNLGRNKKPPTADTNFTLLRHTEAR